jgi:hypothetical protein
LFLLRSMPNMKNLIERIRSFNNVIEVKGEINVQHVNQGDGE